MHGSAWIMGRCLLGLLFLATLLLAPGWAAAALLDSRNSEQVVNLKIAAQALHFLRVHRDRPFLLFVNHHAVHAPLDARPELIEKYRAKAARTGVTDIHPTYAAMTEMGDQALGQVLAELDRLGLGGKTVVIFTSDNGGLISDLHLSIPTPLATRNLPLLRGTGDVARDGLFWHFPTSMWSRWPGGAIRKGDFKLIEFYEDRRVELYDLGNDLGETKDLAAQRPDLARALRTELHQWRRSIDAHMPAPNPDFDPGRADHLADPPVLPASLTPRSR